MEENNELIIEEIPKELSNLEILEIFSQYPLFPIAICEPNNEPVSAILEGIDYRAETVISERVNYPISYIKLILKSVEKITDEESLNIAIEYFGEKYREKIISYQGRELVKSLFNDEIEFTPLEFLNLNSIIKAHGFATKNPFGKNHWAKNKNLFELNLAIESKK